MLFSVISEEYSLESHLHFEHGFDPLGFVAIGGGFEFNGSADSVMTLEAANLTEEADFLSSFSSNFSLAVSKYNQGHLGSLSFNFETFNENIKLDGEWLKHLVDDKYEGFGVEKYIQLYYQYVPYHLSAVIRATVVKGDAEPRSASHHGHSGEEPHGNGHEHHEEEHKDDKKSLAWLFTLAYEL